MKATVCKILDFPASHANLHHDGHCRRIHGHTWTLEIYCYGRIVEDVERPDYGMVVDFHKVKEMYAELVEPFVEHEHLNDSLAGILDEFTTELVAGWILKQLAGGPGGIGGISSISKVRLWEGKSSFVEVTRHDVGLGALLV